MARMKQLVLTVNGGSSSIKFAVFPPGEANRLFSGQIERIGQSGSRLAATKEAAGAQDIRPLSAADHREAAAALIAYVQERLGSDSIAGIGHRIVHGGIHLIENQRVDDALLAELRKMQPLDLAHLPREIALIESFRKSFPSLPQVACFDTAFHRDMPNIAKLLPIPRKYHDEGIRRFGFHGLSYTYLMKRLKETAGAEAANGRVILAHLGSGASMAAVRGGKPVDTTMSFTPTSGLVMGTRPGDLDPGLLVYLMRAQKMSPDEMDKFISSQCGLLGVSGTSSDVRDLIAKRATDPRAAEALDLFCYQAKKFIGALHAVLGGLDTIVFAGGIGEHSPEIRAGICDGLQCFGISVDAKRNAAGQDVISTEQSRVIVRVIPTDEEIVIAEAVFAVLNQA
ncbi:MAG TPA: acetate/propionate family kinase [Tepidisphaeraceae bacterium]|jgi:acetate kinase